MRMPPAVMPSKNTQVVWEPRIAEEYEDESEQEKQGSGGACNSCSEGSGAMAPRGASHGGAAAAARACASGHARAAGPPQAVALRHLQSATLRSQRWRCQGRQWRQRVVW